MAAYRIAISLVWILCLLPIEAVAEWEVSASTDQMTSKKIQFAIAASTNTVEFDFPYRGPQHGYLQLRVHPRYGQDVIFSVTRGQFLCRPDACDVLVRFDDQEPEEFNTGEPADHSNNYLFISDYDRFVSKLIKARTVRIEAPFYQSGRHIFTFDVSQVPDVFANEFIERELSEKQSAVHAHMITHWNAEDDRIHEEERKRQQAMQLEKQFRAEDLKEHLAALTPQQRLIYDFRARISAKVRSRIVVPPDMSGKPETFYEVVLLPGGDVLQATLKKSSGVPAYDAAVRSAIKAAQPLPVPSDPNLFQDHFRQFNMKFRPNG